MNTTNLNELLAGMELTEEQRTALVAGINNHVSEQVRAAKPASKATGAKRGPKVKPVVWLSAHPFSGCEIPQETPTVKDAFWCRQYTTVYCCQCGTFMLVKKTRGKKALSHTCNDCSTVQYDSYTGRRFITPTEEVSATMASGNLPSFESRRNAKSALIMTGWNFDKVNEEVRYKFAFPSSHNVSRNDANFTNFTKTQRNSPAQSQILNARVCDSLPTPEFSNVVYYSSNSNPSLNEMIATATKRNS